MTLLAQVVAVLDTRGTEHCLIGAAALASHGLTRSTHDLDLLVVDAAVLQREAWGALPAEVHLEIFHGDPLEDDLRGTARFSHPSERPVDVVVGRMRWMAGVLARSTPLTFEGVALRQPRLEDLVALKLDAGGVRDLADVRDLLSQQSDPELPAKVAALLADLPARLARRWADLNA